MNTSPKWHKSRSTGLYQQGSRQLFKDIRESSDPGPVRVIYYSYGTPIAAVLHDGPFRKVVTNPRHYSRTTSRHMGYVLKDLGYPESSAAADDRDFRTIVFGSANSGGGRY